MTPRAPIAVLASVLTAVLALALAGCGDGSVAVDSSVANPYVGPMYVEPDHSDDATAVERAGAAGLALECVGEAFEGGGADYVDGGAATVQGSPTEALANFAAHAPMPVGPDDFVVERTEGERVLYSYDVDGRTMVAAIAANGLTDYEDDTGWGIEGWGQCDPAELPADVAEAAGHEVWTDADGRRVPVTRVTSSRGPEHCGWERATFLTLGPYDGHAYLGTPPDGLRRQLSTAYDADSRLPGDATDTGYEHDGWHLWLGTGPRAAYLVSTTDDDDVQRWPWAVEEIWCA